MNDRITSSNSTVGIIFRYPHLRGELFEGGIIRGGNYYFKLSASGENNVLSPVWGHFCSRFNRNCGETQGFSLKTVDILASLCTAGQARPNSGLQIARPNSGLQGLIVD